MGYGCRLELIFAAKVRIDTDHDHHHTTTNTTTTINTVSIKHLVCINVATVVEQCLDACGLGGHWALAPSALRFPIMGPLLWQCTSTLQRPPAHYQAMTTTTTPRPIIDRVLRNGALCPVGQCSARAGGGRPYRCYPRGRISHHRRGLTPPLPLHNKHVTIELMVGVRCLHDTALARLVVALLWDELGQREVW